MSIVMTIPLTVIKVSGTDPFCKVFNWLTIAFFTVGSCAHVVMWVSWLWTWWTDLTQEFPSFPLYFSHYGHIPHEPLPVCSLTILACLHYGQSNLPQLSMPDVQSLWDLDALVAWQFVFYLFFTWQKDLSLHWQSKPKLMVCANYGKLLCGACFSSCSPKMFFLQLLLLSEFIVWMWKFSNENFYILILKINPGYLSYSGSNNCPIVCMFFTKVDNPQYCTS